MGWIHQIIWGPWMLAAFLLVGVWHSCRSGWFQVTGIRRWWNETAGSLGKTEKKEKTRSGAHSVTQFQAACTALAATVGTGNIVGVATALTAGGAGAIFWMWVSAGIGMMTAYAETVLGLKYRYRDQEGHWICGPMVYLEKGLKCRWLGLAYSFFCMMAALGMGSMVQANSLAETLHYSFQLSQTVIGIVTALLVFLIVGGGIGRIARVTEKLVPFSAGIYIFFSLMVILSCYDRLPMAFSAIWESAKSPVSFFGGTGGYVISKSLKYGISRGVFSNEAGLGTLSILHGATEGSTPEVQGMWAMFEVFFDTVIICTLTALVILCMAGSDLGAVPYDGAALTTWCFSMRLGKLGEYLVAAAMVLFAFATMIAWYYMGKQAVTYLSGIWPSAKWWFEHLYLIFYLNAVFLGCITRVELVWEFSDIWNGLMAAPNLLALILLRKEIRYPKKRQKNKTKI